MILVQVRLDLVVVESIFVVGVVVVVEELVVVIALGVVVVGRIIEPGVFCLWRVSLWRYFSRCRGFWWIRLLQVPDHQLCKLWITVFSGAREICKIDAPLHAHLVVPGVGYPKISDFIVATA